MREADIASVIADVLAKSGFRVAHRDSDDRPSILGVHPEKGTLAIDITENGSTGKLALNRRVANLRQEFEELAGASIARALVYVGDGPAPDGFLHLEEVLEPRWLDGTAGSPLRPEDFAALCARLFPYFTFESHHRASLTDEAAAQRASTRFTLDAVQAAGATVSVEDVLLITGPPGSGKTLTLAARARSLAAQHPSWRVQVLCFNRLLAPYLRRLVANWPNVEVATFGRFVSGLGFRIDLESEDEARVDVATALQHAHPVVDALLVDEWQDFLAAWTPLLLALVRPRHGGVVLAGDPKQALYRESDMRRPLEGRSVAEIRLDRPYRSTHQILDVTSALDDELGVVGREQAPDGPPVDLVYADTLRDQAHAIARDIAALLEDRSCAAGDIGILYTRRFQLGSLCFALKEREIDHQVALPRDADHLDLTSDVVHVMTVHSAKGHEFGTVFLCGLEYLPAPDAPSGRQQARTGYVGATRAKDRLIITYSKDNPYLRRLRGVPDHLLRQWVWPDDFPEVGHGAP